MKAAKNGADKLKEINEALSPFYSKQLSSTQASLGPAFADTAFPVVLRPPMMPQPTQQAMYNTPYTIVGRTILWSNPMMYVPAKKGRGEDLIKRAKKRCNKCREPKMYDSDPGHKCAALGRGRECDYFDDNNTGSCWRC